MPKLTRKKLEREVLLICAYKWEFLRRNEHFISDYEKHQSLPENEVLGKSEETDEYYLKTYGVDGLHLNPRVSILSAILEGNEEVFVQGNEIFVKLASCDGATEKESSCHLTAMYQATTAVSRIAEVKHNPFAESLNETALKLLKYNGAIRRNILEVRIDLGASAKRREHDLQKLTELESILVGAGGYGSKNQFQKYDDYLRTYDAWSKNRNRTMRELAKELYPEKYEKIKETAHTKYSYTHLFETIKNDLETARHLVSEGYKKIR